MLKNIFLHLEYHYNLTTAHQFCRQHTTYLEQNGFWKPTFEEIYQVFPPYLQWIESLNEHFYLVKQLQILLNLSSTAHSLTLINESLVNKPHIHSLLLNISDNSQEDIIFIISLLKRIFPKVILHVFWQPCTTDLLVERMINVFPLIGDSAKSAPKVLIDIALKINQNVKQVKSQLLSMQSKALFIDIEPKCEENNLSQWQNWMGFPKPYPQIQPINFKCSPKVLAFIREVQPMFWGMTCKPPYNWLGQEKIFTFEEHIITNNLYIKDYCKNLLRNDFNQKMRFISPVDDKEYLAKLSDIPITINAEDAQELVALLTPDFRKLLVADIDQAGLKYKAQDKRNALGALLLAEKLIDEDEFKKLTAHPQGAHLPIFKDSIIEVSDAPPIVAVLTLCYNQKDFIEENILSVMAQKTNFPVVHIISDDASTDGTQEILKKYATQYPHIHLLINERNDLPQSIINIFNQAKTPYVALCDGDDYFIDPLKLQSQVDLLEANPSYGLCFHLVKILYENHPEVEHIYPKESSLSRGVRKHYYLVDLMRSNPIQTNSVMYRWRFREGLPVWFNSYLCPGDWYWHLLHAECGKVGFINKVMSVYRRHKSGLFYKTAHDVAAHRRRYGMREIGLYEHLNLHFEGRYEKIMYYQILRVFKYMLDDAENTEDKSAFEAIVKAYPDHVKKL